tara:strand:+ start:63 stop:194 length:132 start_codon:yes stop_codon:yes gene_type:complete
MKLINKINFPICDKNIKKIINIFKKIQKNKKINVFFFVFLFFS